MSLSLYFVNLFFIFLNGLRDDRHHATEFLLLVSSESIVII